MRYFISTMVLVLCVMGGYGFVYAQPPRGAEEWQTIRVSVASDGMEANSESGWSAVSDDGRWVAFTSFANNLVVSDTNGQPDVFVHDRDAGITERVSVASDGDEANSGSFYPAISADGRYVVFQSAATLIPDAPDFPLLYFYDRLSETLEVVAQAGDGTLPDGAMVRGVISADGQTVAFQSAATNLVVGDTNAVNDVFVWERTTGTVTRVSVASDGSQGIFGSTAPDLSADGLYIAFTSNALLVANDTNGASDVYRHDRTTGETLRLSVQDDGSEFDTESSQAAISGDGSVVVFAQNLNIYSRDIGINHTTLVSRVPDGDPANNFSDSPDIAADGSTIVFFSAASNLVVSDTNGVGDVFRLDRAANTLTLISLSTDGEAANDTADDPVVSGDGRVIAFRSLATNLVMGDTNVQNDIFSRVLRATPTSTPTPLPTATSTSFDLYLPLIQRAS